MAQESISAIVNLGLNTESHAADAEHVQGDTLFHKVLYTALGPSDTVESKHPAKSADSLQQATRVHRAASQFEDPRLDQQLARLQETIQADKNAVAELKKICDQLETVRGIKDSILTSQGQGLLVKVLVATCVSSNIATPAIIGGTFVALTAADLALSHVKTNKESTVSMTTADMEAASSAVYRTLIKRLAEKSKEELNTLKSSDADPAVIKHKEQELSYLNTVTKASLSTPQTKQLSELFNDAVMVRDYANEKDAKHIGQRKRHIQDRITALENAGSEKDVTIYQTKTKKAGFIPSTKTEFVTGDVPIPERKRKLTGTIEDSRWGNWTKAKKEVLQKELTVVNNLLSPSNPLEADKKEKKSPATPEQSHSSARLHEAMHPHERKTLSSENLLHQAKPDSSVDSPKVKAASGLDSKFVPPPLERKKNNTQTPAKSDTESLGSKIAFQTERIKSSAFRKEHKRRIKRSNERIDAMPSRFEACKQALGKCAAAKNIGRPNQAALRELESKYIKLMGITGEIRDKLASLPTHIEKVKERLADAKFDKNKTEYRLILKEYLSIQREYTQILRDSEQIGTLLDYYKGNSKTSVSSQEMQSTSLGTHGGSSRSTLSESVSTSSEEQSLPRFASPSSPHSPTKTNTAWMLRQVGGPGVKEEPAKEVASSFGVTQQKQDAPVISSTQVQVPKVENSSDIRDQDYSQSRTLGM